MNNNFFQKSLCSLVIVGKALLKLVFLEWSGSKPGSNFGFSMLKKPPVQIFGAIGQPVTFDSILQFSLDDTGM